MPTLNIEINHILISIIYWYQVWIGLISGFDLVWYQVLIWFNIRFCFDLVWYQVWYLVWIGLIRLIWFELVWSELGTFEWWISGLRLDPLFFLISRLNNAVLLLLLISRLINRSGLRISHSEVFSSELKT